MSEPVTRRSPRRARRRRHRSPWPLYSFVAALGFARVFGDWQFVADVARRRASSATACRSLLRRLHVPGVAAVGAHRRRRSVWTIAWLAYPSTFAAVFPTRETWDIAWADLGLVRDQFQTAVAPVEYVGGWSLLATIGTAFVVLTSDTFAFHARARGEALVPGAVLFVFVAALGADRHRVGLTLAARRRRVPRRGRCCACASPSRRARCSAVPATRCRSPCRRPPSPGPPSCSAPGSSARACPAPAPRR